MTPADRCPVCDRPECRRDLRAEVDARRIVERAMTGDPDVIADDLAECHRLFAVARDCEAHRVDWRARYFAERVGDRVVLTDEQAENAHHAMYAMLRSVERLLAGEQPSDFTPEGLEAVRGDLLGAINTIIEQRDRIRRATR